MPAQEQATASSDRPHGPPRRSGPCGPGLRCGAHRARARAKLALAWPSRAWRRAPMLGARTDVARRIAQSRCATLARLRSSPPPTARGAGRPSRLRAAIVVLDAHKAAASARAGVAARRPVGVAEHRRLMGLRVAARRGAERRLFEHRVQAAGAAGRWPHEGELGARPREPRSGRHPWRSQGRRRRVDGQPPLARATRRFQRTERSVKVSYAPTSDVRFACPSTHSGLNPRVRCDEAGLRRVASR